MTHQPPAVLVLADGRIFRGRGFGAAGTTFGEATFSTAMTGYQELLTDPASHGLLLVTAAAHIGNTGWNEEDSRSRDGRIWASGLVIRELTHRVSNWRATGSLPEEMSNQGVIGISGLDTRTLVRYLREHGSQPAGIFSGEAAAQPEEELIRLVKENSVDPVAREVSTSEAYTVPAQGEERGVVAVYDLGVSQSVLQQFAARGVRVEVLAWDTALDSVSADGVVLSHGPGDPAACTEAQDFARAALEKKIPVLGLGLGGQVVARALGRETYQLPHGRRGTNVPVRHLPSDTIAITSQHRGFAVSGEAGEKFDTDFGPAQITHVNLGDASVEGLALDNGLALTVDHDPTAATLDRFVQVLNKNNEN